MQTFLVSYSLPENFTFIDGRRLFKNLIEGRQILQACLDKDYGWQNHPATRQFRNYESLLMDYLEANYKECLNRGIALDTDLWNKANKIAEKFNVKRSINPILPSWWGREDIIQSHKNRLYAKGEIDIICAAIKKQLKIRSIDKWLKQNYKKTKNQLKWADCLVLKKFCAENNIDIIGENHYSKFGWTVIPDGDYVWPV